MKSIKPTECVRQSRSDGEWVTCPGTYEVRVAAYFDRGVDDNGLALAFTALGGGDGTEGVVINCNECGEPAPRIFYACLKPILQALEDKLKEALA
ncbi:hypothetical protein [Streptomyces sp. NPDC086776]|uniref:hypothetical protein n=1 Tax=Streptomyces sp. NPDC086776 TaxID=3365756 RepID=UPI00381C38EC